MKYILLNPQPGMRAIEQQVLEALNSGKIKLTTDKDEFTYMGVNVKRAFKGKELFILCH